LLLQSQQVECLLPEAGQQNGRLFNGELEVYNQRRRDATCPIIAEAPHGRRGTAFYPGSSRPELQHPSFPWQSPPITYLTFLLSSYFGQHFSGQLGSYCYHQPSKSCTILINPDSKLRADTGQDVRLSLAHSIVFLKPQN